jgi:putative membrane protein
MRNLIIIINLSIIIAITTIFTQSDNTTKNNSEVTEAGSLSTSDISKEIGSAIRSNFPKDEPSSLSEKLNADEEVVTFLLKMTEARLADVEGGKTASQRATSRALKDFGSLVVKDQTNMLEALKAIASKKQISVPEWLGPSKASSLDNLREVHGKTFDKKYIRGMISDLKRDVKILRNATESSDADIQVFATLYLPVLESHLESAKALKRSL